MQEDADTAAPPLPQPVHHFLVRVADRGPSTRALAITVGVALSAAVLLMFAMPKRPPHEVRMTVPTEAPEPVAKPDSIVPPQVEPVPPVTMSRGTPELLGPTAATAAALPTAAAGAAASPLPVAAAAAASPAPRIEPVRAESVTTATPPRVVDVSGSEPLPVGATGRPAADLIVAPAPARDRENEARAAAAPIVSTTVGDQLAPRPRQATKTVDRAAMGASEQPAPAREAQPQPVREPEPRPANE
jgi:hypothetical protein